MGGEEKSRNTQLQFGGEEKSRNAQIGKCWGYTASRVAPEATRQPSGPLLPPGLGLSPGADDGGAARGAPTGHASTGLDAGLARDDAGLARDAVAPPGLNPSTASTALDHSALSADDAGAAIDTPYLGPWHPDVDGALLTASLVLPSPQTRDATGSSTSVPVVALLSHSSARRRLVAHVDSGCSGSLTPSRDALANVRPCSDRFRAADGLEYKATLIGDLPCRVTDARGRRRDLVFRNVRLVPDFRYTLLSVRQIWHEQRIDARFGDTNALVVPGANGEELIPYSSPSGLPTVDLEALATPPLSGDVALSAADDGDRPPSASSRPLGFHRIGATAHVARLPAAQAAELLHRRCLLGVDKLRATPHTTADAPRVLASASAVPPSAAVAAARIKRAPHSSTLSAPAPEPGVLHLDLKELVLSVGGYRYVVFAIDEHSRYVLIDFIKLKSEVADSVKRIVAAFNATVGTPVDEEGHALPRPQVRELHSDREGKLMSKHFLDFRADVGLHHTTSPPHDHDLNPIAERVIGVISEVASAVRASSGAPVGFWPWIISYVVDWHNSVVGSVGSSTADATISPHQRFTLRPPRVMDLAAFGWMRSEERRVGKECRSRWSPYH